MSLPYPSLPPLLLLQNLQKVVFLKIENSFAYITSDNIDCMYCQWMFMLWGLHGMWQLGRCVCFLYIFLGLKNISFPKRVKFPPFLECLCPFSFNVSLKAVNSTKLDAHSWEEGYLFFISYIWFFSKLVSRDFFLPPTPFFNRVKIHSNWYYKKNFYIYIFLFLFIFFWNNF